MRMMVEKMEDRRSRAITRERKLKTRGKLGRKICRGR